MSENSDASSPPIVIYALQNKYLSAVRIDLDPRVLQKLYWVLPLSATEREAVQAVQDNPLGSVLIVDDDGQVVGALTKSEAVRGKCKKKPTKNCRQECERRCANRGGVWYVICDATYWLCRCKDEMVGPDSVEKTVGELFGR